MPGELAAIEDEVAACAQELLRALVIDTDNDHNTRDTGRRLAKMFVRERLAGRYQPAPAVTEFPNAERLNELMIVGPPAGAQRLLAPPVPGIIGQA